MNNMTVATTTLWVLYVIGFLIAYVLFLKFPIPGISLYSVLLVTSIIGLIGVILGIYLVAGFALAGWFDDDSGSDTIFYCLIMLGTTAIIVPNIIIICMIANYATEQYNQYIKQE